jgi:DNA polymerase-3 subunit chi
VDADEVGALERVCILFDGNDPAAVEVARSQWRTLTTAGCAAQYWSQEGGAWAMKTESQGR